METWAFEPLYSPSSGTTGGSFQASTTISANATTATANSTPFSGTNVNGQRSIQIANQSGSWAFVNFGVAGSVTAATVASSYPVAPGSVVVVTVNSEVNGASVILAAGTGNVIFTRGVGL